MSESNDSEHADPQTVCDRAAAAAMEAAEASLKSEGAEIDGMFIALRANDVSDGKNATATGLGFEDAEELLRWLLGYTGQMAQALGVPMRVMYTDKPIGGQG